LNGGSWAWRGALLYAWRLRCAPRRGQRTTLLPRCLQPYATGGGSAGAATQRLPVCLRLRYRGWRHGLALGICERRAQTLRPAFTITACALLAKRRNAAKAATRWVFPGRAARRLENAHPPLREAASCGRGRHSGAAETAGASSARKPPHARAKKKGALHAAYAAPSARFRGLLARHRWWRISGLLLSLLISWYEWYLALFGAQLEAYLLRLPAPLLLP